MKTRVIYVVMALIAMFSLTSCGKRDQNGSSNGTKILFTYSEQEGNEFRTNLAEAAKSYAESQGARLEIEQSNHSVETQVAQMKAAKEKGYKAVICIAEDASTARQLMAAADGLPIIFINAMPEKDVLEANQYIYVGSSEDVAGKYQAEYVLEQSGNKSEINVVLLKGERGHSGTKGRSEAAVETLLASGKKINMVFEDYADWDGERAKEYFEVFLSTGRTADFVLCNNDAMALGVAEAYRKHNIDFAQSPILGVDATAEGCASVKNGEMQFTVYQSASSQGEYAARAAILLANGKSIEELEYASEDQRFVWVPFEEVTSTNVQNYMK